MSLPATPKYVFAREGGAEGRADLVGVLRRLKPGAENFIPVCPHMGARNPARLDAVI